MDAGNNGEDMMLMTDMLMMMIHWEFEFISLAPVSVPSHLGIASPPQAWWISGGELGYKRLQLVTTIP